MDTFKIVFLGSHGVGKTSLICCRDHAYPGDLLITNLAAFTNEVVTLDNMKDLQIASSSTSCKFQRWDTSMGKFAAGMKRHPTVSPIFWRKADGVFIVYDVTDRSSVDAVEHWLATLRNARTVNGNAPNIILVGNKIDLFEQRVVSYEEMVAFGEKHGVFMVVETSAKENLNVFEAFMAMYSAVYTTRTKAIESDLLKNNPKRRKADSHSPVCRGVLGWPVDACILL